MVLAALAFEPEEFDVGVDIFGVANWVRTLESIPPWWESFREALYTELGNPEEDAERLHRISPLFHADNITKPLMVLQGANDPRVLQVESDEMVEAARANGAAGGLRHLRRRRGTASARRPISSVATRPSWNFWTST